MIKHILIGSFVMMLAVGVANAQTAEQTPPEIQSLASDWSAMQNSQKHVAESMQKVISDLHKAQAERDVLKKQIDELKKKTEPSKSIEK